MTSPIYKKIIKMKKDIVIIGSGPRGLAIALQAIKYKNKYNIYLVDNKPLNTWKFPNMLPNLQMRSPISFDLVTFQKDLQKHSLANFLKYKLPYLSTQQEVENQNIFCGRKTFVNYLSNTINLLKKEGCIFIKHKCKNIQENSITLFNNIEVKFDYLIISTGSATSISNYPSFLRKKSNINYVTDLCKQDWFNTEVNVVGTGQQAAEIVHYLLTQKAIVTWVKNKEVIVEQYPVPGFSKWGIGSALGNYYRLIEDKEAYLQNVKNWGPSITPYIHTKLSKFNYRSIIPSSTKELNTHNKFVLAAGSKQDFKLLPWSIKIKESTDPRYPLLKDEFNSVSNSNIYFTGLLALKCDGPRQGSIISSAETARIILSSINRT